MTLFIMGLLIIMAALAVMFLLGKRLPAITGGMRLLLVVVGVCVGIGLVFASTIQPLAPGEMGRAYHLLGGGKDLTVGNNFVAPWNRIYRWNMRAHAMSFIEGTDADDAFGAQTANGDYLTAIANTTLRIDPDRLDAYIERFGNEDIANNTKIHQIIKSELKRAMETALAQYETRELMSNKAKAAVEASEIAKKDLAALPFVVETLWFVDFQASDAYEAAIRDQADLRMRTDKAVLQEQLNKQEAQNNKVKADGEAEVRRVAARAEADANQIRITNETEMAVLRAQNDAEVAKIAAEQNAQVKKVQAEADANVTTTQANANAQARIAQDEAQARGLEAIGKAYAQHPPLLDLKRVELEGQWAAGWNGMLPQFQGMEAFSFADFTQLFQRIVESGTAQPVIEP